MEWKKVSLIYLGAVNILTFLLFGWDKMQAGKNGRRVAERTLFIFVFLGGGAGAIAGMKAWHHKTRKWYFRWGIPAIVLFQLGAVLYLMGRMSRG